MGKACLISLFGVRPTPLNKECTPPSLGLRLKLAAAPLGLVELQYFVISNRSCIIPTHRHVGVVTNTDYNIIGHIVRTLIHCLRQGSMADKPHTSQCPIVSVADITDCATSLAGLDNE